VSTRRSCGAASALAVVTAAVLAFLAQDARRRVGRARELLAHALEASARERRRLASGVHDDAIQVMSAHVMGLQLLRRRVTEPATLESVRELEATGRAAVARLRDLMVELDPPALADEGLVRAIEVMVEQDGADGDRPRVTSLLDRDPEPAVSDTAYRTLRDVVVAFRGVTAVTLRRDRGGLVVAVTAPAGAAPDADALARARERASVLGGTVALEPAPGGTTVAVCRLPWSVASLPRA
jgi:signal transduction histidine kinase